MKEPIHVIGHKNPDTDSICSAIGYAYLRNALGDTEVRPARAGELNSETRYVLERFLPTGWTMVRIGPGGMTLTTHTHLADHPWNNQSQDLVWIS